MIAFIGCVKGKQSKKCKASEMYTSDLFKKALTYAQKTQIISIFYLQNTACYI